MSIGRKISGVVVGGRPGGGRLHRRRRWRRRGGRAARSRATPAEASFSVRGSTGQVGVTDAEPGTTLTARRRRRPSGRRLLRPGRPPRQPRCIVDEDGNLGFGRVPPGEGYRVVVDPESAMRPPSPSEVTVGALDDIPDVSLFEGPDARRGVPVHRDARRDAALGDGAVPRERSCPAPRRAGPYPTLIEMSGYDPSNPGLARTGHAVRRVSTATPPSASTSAARVVRAAR